MKSIRIERKEKNLMRSQLETILAIQKDIGSKIDSFQEEVEAEEYLSFWKELKVKNNEDIKRVSTYMVRKCNR